MKNEKIKLFLVDDDAVFLKSLSFPEGESRTSNRGRLRLLVLLAVLISSRSRVLLLSVLSVFLYALRSPSNLSTLLLRSMGVTRSIVEVDVGWEGINYSIQRLDGSVVYYNRSLYTYH